MTRLVAAIKSLRFALLLLERLDFDNNIMVSVSFDIGSRICQIHRFVIINLAHPTFGL